MLRADKYTQGEQNMLVTLRSSLRDYSYKFKKMGKFQKLVTLIGATFVLIGTLSLMNALSHCGKWVCSTSALAAAVLMFVNWTLLSLRLSQSRTMWAANVLLFVLGISWVVEFIVPPAHDKPLLLFVNFVVFLGLIYCCLCWDPWKLKFQRPRSTSSWLQNR